MCVYLYQGNKSMCTKKQKDKNERKINMESTAYKEFSLSKFVKKNKLKIEQITPVNPSISKGDEWNNELYDKLYKDVDKK